MERRIIVPYLNDDSMGSSINVLLKVMRQLNGVQTGDSVIIDLTGARFFYPIFILPLSSSIAKLRDEGHEVNILGSTGYLDTILFSEGFNAIGRADWKEALNYYRDRTYLPICLIPSRERDFDIRDSLINVFEDIMRVQLNITGILRTVISYLIAEKMTNIVNHAMVTNGWIMVQNYPSKQFLDICILDTGVGILGSYAHNNFPAITSDELAIRSAVNGVSTKQIAETRGFGISTSRRMLVDGLKGKYFLFSGTAFYIYTDELEQITKLDRSYRWNGTMLVLRIPRDIPQVFNYINYLE